MAADRTEVALKLIAVNPVSMLDYLNDMGGCRDAARLALTRLQRKRWVHATTRFSRGFHIYEITQSGLRRLRKMGYAA